MAEAFDARAWLRRWDAQQSGYMPGREARFAVMLDLVEAQVGTEPLVLDLACGPGSVSERLLNRLPGARSIAIDMDPALLAIGQGALDDAAGRLRWVEVDLRDPGWSAPLSGEPVDVVLTTTALHWLSEPELRRVYADLAALVRPGGVLLNGDHMGFTPDQAGIGRAAATAKAHRSDAAKKAETWADWWDALHGEPALADALKRRDERLHDHPHHDKPHDVALHTDALRSAGFTEAGIVWQDLDDRVLMALR